jgi:hypothetical protein
MGKIKIQNMYTKVASGVSVDTTSRSGQWLGLSPFFLGPCDLYGGRVARNFENAWQYAKVYQDYADKTEQPTPEYWTWAEAGWANPKAVRYPMGRGAKPLYSLWNGERLGYIDARKRIYAPLYAKLVQATDSFQQLKDLVNHSELVVLRDFDGYDHDAMGLSLTEVLNLPTRKMGHSFVLKMLLTGDECLEQCKGG